MSDDFKSTLQCCTGRHRADNKFGDQCEQIETFYRYCASDKRQPICSVCYDYLQHQGQYSSSLFYYIAINGEWFYKLK